MGRVRTFYGHEGVVYPTGLIPSGAGADEADVEEIETIPGTEGYEPNEVDAEAIDLPDNSWKVGKIDSFASEHGITFDDGATKPEKLAVIQKWADDLPTLGAAEED